MLDEYLRGDVTRISPEAPVPVVEVCAQDFRLGGAANAAANIQALGGITTLVGAVGVDDTRPTSKKTRIVAQQQQIVRVDHEKRQPVTGAVADELRRAIDRA